MIKDLLPLYYDEACSEQSRKIVDEHLAECPSCQNMMKNMQDTTYNRCLETERDEVLNNYLNNARKKILLIGSCLLLIPIVVCFIVNIAVGNTLDWFFIVLASLMVLASFTLTPLVVPAKKRLWTLASFTASLLLLLLICCLYTKGDWFFTASAGVLLGFSVVFVPFVIDQAPLKGSAAKNHGLICMSLDTLLLYLLIIACGFTADSVSYWRPALLISTVCVVFVWILFLIIRYLKTDGFIKAGLCSIICGLFLSFIHDFIALVLDGYLYLSLSDANLLLWNSDRLINANGYLLFLLAGCIIGIILLMIGFVRKSRKNTEKSI